MEELAGYDAIALGELLQNGEITPAELLDSTIQRIDKVNPQLNAVIVRMVDQAHDLAETWRAKLSKDHAVDALFCIMMRS